MSEFLQNSVFFGVILSLSAYGLGVVLKKRFKWAIFNPILIAIGLTILVLVLLDIDYETYAKSTQILTYLTTPATICLAVPLYEQFQVLKKNYQAVVFGILSGVITALLTVLALVWVLGMSRADYATLLPKSVTTAIGMGISEELGGYAAITAVIIILTGVIGNVIAQTVCRIFRITHPIAKGVALGTSAHILGTAKAMEMGRVEGAMSGLSIVVAGLLTVVGAALFVQIPV